MAISRHCEPASARQSRTAWPKVRACGSGLPRRCASRNDDVYDRATGPGFRSPVLTQTDPLPSILFQKGILTPEDLKRFDVSTLFIHGEDDQIVPIPQAVGQDIAVYALNRMLEFGRPIAVRIA
jgi:pimeloyl-ACP methyl ester carboxylesterase